MQGIDQYEVLNSQVNLDDLVRQHSSIVLKIAKNMKRKLPSSVEFEDLVQSGFVGLIEASKSFKSDMGAKFETYASIRIKGSMLDDLRKNSWNTREAIKNIKQVGAAICAVEQRTRRQASPTDVADELGVNIEEYNKLCYDINICSISSIHDLIESNIINVHEESPEDIAEADSSKKKIRAVLEQLPERERILLSLYYIEELTFKEVGEVLDITEARVCQIHAAAISKISKRIA
tara:strand:+ start:69 stop:770 length:702 start_codon:yes stop_codon:yes gene_type:complete